MNLRVPILAVVTAILWTGCAFDITEVNQRPATFVSNTGENLESFTLVKDVKARLGTGFPTRLQAGTRWQEVGSTQYGKVFSTKDQVVTVEAADIYEADLVVSNQFITGFYLLVEKTFAPVTSPIPIQITTSDLNKKP